MNLKSIIETILFVRAEPTDIKTLVKHSKHSEEEVRAALAELADDYSERGFVLLEKDGSWQFASNPTNGSYIEELVKNEFTQELSRSSLETLAIIAYKGPISRIEVEYLRGVNSSFTVRNLLMRGLIERVENPKDARSYLYRATFDFLKHFGLTSMEHLPRFGEFNKQVIEIPEEKPEVSAI
ncbi:MAG: SMC-Scp complex subunit ScpB [bacterium]|nr:SMC-Scp complex subunit ScpB [bacterium]MDZ4285773.1 SMC-Scp complex subunit ScpB [Candidatus Sungbacteria bacterium]